MVWKGRVKSPLSDARKREKGGHSLPEESLLTFPRKSRFFRLLAGKDEWFSDDLRKLDDENVYRKL